VKTQLPSKNPWKSSREPLVVREPQIENHWHGVTESWQASSTGLYNLICVAPATVVYRNYYILRHCEARVSTMHFFMLTCHPRRFSWLAAIPRSSEWRNIRDVGGDWHVCFSGM